VAQDEELALGHNGNPASESERIRAEPPGGHPRVVSPPRARAFIGGVIFFLFYNKRSDTTRPKKRCTQKGKSRPAARGTQKEVLKEAPAYRNIHTHNTPGGLPGWCREGKVVPSTAYLLCGRFTKSDLISHSLVEIVHLSENCLVIISHVRMEEILMLLRPETIFYCNGNILKENAATKGNP